MPWLPLPYEEWKDSRDTLHMQLQVIGKVRLALSPLEPQWANVPLYLTGRGLWTSTIPHPGGEVFDIDGLTVAYGKSDAVDRPDPRRQTSVERGELRAPDT